MAMLGSVLDSAVVNETNTIQPNHFQEAYLSAVENYRQVRDLIDAGGQ